MTTRTVYCLKLKQESEGLAQAPFPGELGQKIYDHISQQAWQEWIRLQTMLINEYRLNMLDHQAQEFLQTEMQKFLFEEGAEPPPGFQSPSE